MIPFKLPLFIFLAVWKCSSFISNRQESFPLREFFNTSDKEFLAMQRIHLCTDHLRSEMHCCSCNNKCIRQKNCCVDYLWNTMNFTNFSAYKNYLIGVSRQYKNQVCYKAFPPELLKINFVESKPYYMVDRCLPDTDAKYAFMCEEISSNAVPVLGDDDYLYRNSYCAKCNNVSEIKMLPVRIRCDDMHKRCFIELDVPDYHSMDYCSRFEKNCEIDSIYYDLCHAFVGPYKGYANYFCYLCSRKPLVYNRFKRCFFLTLFKPLSWAAILQFGGSSPKSNKDCGENKVFAALGTCTNYNCPLGYRASKGNCIQHGISSLTAMTYLTFDDCFLTQNISITLTNVTNPKKTIDYLVLNYGSRVSVESNSTNITIIYLRSTNESNALQQIEDIGYFLDEDDEVFIELSRGGAQSHQQNYTHQMKCAKRILLAEKVIFTSQCNAVTGKTVFPKWNVFMFLNISKYETKRLVYTCKTFYNGCPLRILDSNLTTIQDGGKLAYVSDEGNKTYGVKEYTLISENVHGVCIDIVKSPTMPAWYSTVQIIDGYISISGSFLSIISYIIVLTTFFLFEQPFNMPTYCAIALCTSLFFADGLFLSMNILHLFEFDRSPLTCDIIGSVDHFFLISGQIWCVIMAVNLANSLKSITLLNQSSIRSKFIKYCLISYIGSLITVILAIVLRETRILDAEYETREVCLFNAGPLVRVVLQILPLIVSFIASLLFISFSIHYVAKENQRNNEILGRTQYVNITRIALKLIFMFGIPEGIGLIYVPKAMSNNEMYINIVFGVFYSIAKGFRGIMLLLLYVCKRSVIDMYKARFSMRKSEGRVKWEEQRDSAKETSASTTF